MRRTLLVLCAVALASLALMSVPGPAAAVTLTPDDISWHMVGTGVVRFQLHFHNDGTTPSAPVSGTLYSQEFGAFLPHYGVIGAFDVPPIEPESFFDVYFEVPLSSLPPNPALGVSAMQAEPCPPVEWVGNVDVQWTEPEGPVQVNKHYGNVGVCPGGPKSCLHVITNCVGVTTWAVRNVCQGWTVTLENEDHTPAPANLPAGWTGWICVAASANVPVGSTCCFAVDLTCLGVTATINVCGYACDCSTPTRTSTWGRLKQLYR